jgi:hypothetical protein
MDMCGEYGEFDEYGENGAYLNLLGRHFFLCALALNIYEPYRCFRT